MQVRLSQCRPLFTWGGLGGCRSRLLLLLGLLLLGLLLLHRHARGSRGRHAGRGSSPAHEWHRDGDDGHDAEPEPTTAVMMVMHFCHTCVRA